MSAANERFSGNPLHNYSEFYKVLYRPHSSQVTRNLISSIRILIYKLLHELPNNLNLGP